MCSSRGNTYQFVTNKKRYTVTIAVVSFCPMSPSHPSDLAACQTHPTIPDHLEYLSHSGHKPLLATALVECVFPFASAGNAAISLHLLHSSSSIGGYGQRFDLGCPMGGFSSQHFRKVSKLMVGAMPGSPIPQSKPSPPLDW
jgi:hypothetical protein